jgi:hypothetical protein
MNPVYLQYPSSPDNLEEPDKAVPILIRKTGYNFQEMFKYESIYHNNK